jgi:hypothetical protein
MRTIPIAPVASAFSDCEESGIVPKQNLPLARREFLKGSGILMGTLAAGSVLAGLAPSTVWAVELKTLSQAEGETLMAMARTIYPAQKIARCGLRHFGQRPRRCRLRQCRHRQHAA